MILAAILALAIQEAGPRACVPDGNTLELNACAAEDLEREEARMRRYFDTAMDRARADDREAAAPGPPPQGEAWLRASQTAWASYSEIRCQGVLDQWKGGSIRTLMYLACKTEAARQRSHDIWTDYLTFADSTPPVLPEPVMTVADEAPRGSRSDQR